MEPQFPPGESFSAISKQSGFNFSLYKGRVDWKKLGALDVDRLISEKDLELLSDLLRNVTNLNLESDFDVKVLDPNFVKLFRLAQLSVDFLLHCKVYLEKCLSDSQHKLNVAVQEVNSLRRVCEERKMELKRVKKQLREQTTSLLQTSHKCYVCGKVFIEESYLQSHHSRRHPDRTYMSPESEATRVNDSTETAAMLRVEIKQLKERLNFAELQLNKRFEGTSPRLGTEEVENETSSLKEDVMALRNLLHSEIKKLKDNGKQDKADYSCKTQDVQNVPVKSTAEVSTNTDTYNEQENLANLLARFLSTANRGGNGDIGQESNFITRTYREIPDNLEDTDVTSHGKPTLVGLRNTVENVAETSKRSVAREERIVEAQAEKSSDKVENEEPDFVNTKTSEVNTNFAPSKVTFDRITMVTPKTSATVEVEDGTSVRNQNLTEKVNVIEDLQNRDFVPRSRKNTVSLLATKSRTFSAIDCEEASASESDVKTVPEIESKDSESKVEDDFPRLEPPRPKPRSRTGNKTHSSDGSASEVEKPNTRNACESEKFVKDLEVRSISSAESTKEPEVGAKFISNKPPSLQKRGILSQKSVWQDNVLEESSVEHTLEQGDVRKTPAIFITQSSDENKTSNPQRTLMFANSEISEFVEETSSDLDSVQNVPIEKVNVVDRSALRTNTVLSSSLGSSKNEESRREPIETLVTRTTDERDKKDVGSMFGTPLNETRENNRTDNVDGSKTKADKTLDSSLEKRRQERVTDSDDSALIVPDSESVGANVQLLLATNPEILQALRCDLENMLGRRLRDLGIDPEWTQLPDRTYRDKKAALDHHKNIVAKRYHNYFKLQKEIEVSLEQYFAEKSDLGDSSSGYPFAATSTPRSTSDAGSSQLRMTISDSESTDSQGDRRRVNPVQSSMKQSVTEGALRQRKRVVFMDELSSGRSTPRLIGVHSVVVAASSDSQSKQKRLHHS
ncbi:hypothetical protein LSTR_LSTR010677 [Laodelphax striatellus]|uniref:C2H2-type domain-containing protein n=1 Tax=Laodelphax striatellus TaxID=195883 RepID=A0A482WTE9_LAOST|nr:hypothetical protein LSTR_LSTR010677 [Laodelphax striatellus]